VKCALANLSSKISDLANTQASQISSYRTCPLIKVSTSI
jgi:hypothetical protein